MTDKGKVHVGGPNDPEHSALAAGVGFVTSKRIITYPPAKQVKDYADAEKTGRLSIRCFDLGGQTLTCANIYGWAGGKQGNGPANRTNDLLTVAIMQLECMGNGPKCIAGDYNGTVDAFPALTELTKHGWTDIGADPNLCKGEPNQPTCQASGGAGESRIDYIFANPAFHHMITSCQVCKDDLYPTHKPLRVTFNTNKTIREAKQLKRPTNFADLFEEKVQKDFQTKLEQHATDNNANEHEAPHETQIRNLLKASLHNLMKHEIAERRKRLDYAQRTANSDMQMLLISAAIEEANIKLHKLNKRDAEALRGRA